jgi:hypothetical protein
MMELERSNDLEFYDVMNKQMKSWQDVVDVFKHFANARKTKYEIICKICEGMEYI